MRQAVLRDNIEADQCLDWRAQSATFADDAEAEFRTVPVGTLDFATLRLREGVSVFEMLDEIGGGAVPFAPVFTDDELSSAARNSSGFATPRYCCLRRGLTSPFTTPVTASESRSAVTLSSAIPPA